MGEKENVTRSDREREDGRVRESDRGSEEGKREGELRWREGE